MEKCNHKTVQEARECFLATVTDNICSIGKDEDLRVRLKVKFAGLGLLSNDIGKEFLASRDWSDRSRREEYLEIIREFLDKVIR